MATVGRVVVDVDANTAKLEKKLDKAIRRMDRFGNRTKRVDRAFRNLSVGIGSVGFTFFARSVVDAGNKMEGFERALTVASGSAVGAKRELKFLDDLTGELGVNFEATASSFSKFAAAAKGSNLEGDKTREVFTSVAKAARVLNLSAADTQGIFRALEQMMSKGKVQAEELRGQLGERLPGAFNLAAKAMGVTTAELDKLLKLGKVTAEDLLPKLARELDTLFGSQVAAASASAAANIERFNNELFRSKVAVSEGFLPAISALVGAFSAGLPVVIEFARVMGEIFAGGRGFGAFADVLDKQIEALTLRRNQLRNQIAGVSQPGAREDGFLGDLVRKLKGIGSVEESLSKYRGQLESVNEELAILKKRQLDSFGPSAGSDVERLSEIFITTKKRTSDYEIELKKLSKTFMTAEARAEGLRTLLSRFREDLSAGTIGLIEKEIDNIINGGLEEIVITAKRRFTKPMKKEFDEIEEAAKQAARNIQDAFAQFLFDPFQDGLNGMVRGFLDAIRRMLANQAAIQLFGFLGGLFNKGGVVTGGGTKSPGPSKTHNPLGFANGGSFEIGGSGGADSQLIPFFGTPGERVTVTKPGQSGGVVNHFNITVDASGEDADRVLAIVPPAIEQSVEMAVGRMFELRAKGQF